MSKETEETLLILAAVVGLMVVVYELFKPAPAPTSDSDLSWSQAGQIAGIAIALV